ncbi:MAG: dihydropteroate synthase [bacterium]
MNALESGRVKHLDVDSLKDVIGELVRAGCAPERMEEIATRAVFRGLRVEGLDARAALAVQEEMLSAGGEAAVPGNALESAGSDLSVLLFGTLGDYRRLMVGLGSRGERFRPLAAALRTALMNVEGSKPPPPVECARGRLVFGSKTYVMGIINVTPDSFYDGGKHFEIEKALNTAVEMHEAGVDIIDVGGESSRPGAAPASEEEELRRTVPVIKGIRGSRARGAIISIDTRKAVVAEKALEAGADIINDVSALRHDAGMAKVAAESGAPVCLMHMLGTPADMQNDPRYVTDVVFEIVSFLAERVEYAVSRGVRRERIIIDPGIGFGKTVEHNLEILNRLREFRVLGHPVLVGASRKSFIGKVSGLEAGERLEGSLAAAVAAAARGADVVRVHDFAETLRAVRVADAVFRKRRMVRGG